MEFINLIHQIDCLALMRALATGSVDVLISDPPYHTTKLHYDQAPMIEWAAWWHEANRVVKPGGTIVLFADDLFTVDLILTNRKQYRYRLVWEKTRWTRFLSANSRPLKAHEDILVFQRYPKRAVYNPQKTAGKPYVAKGKRSAAMYGQDSEKHIRTPTINSGDRHPGTVLRFASTTDTKHPNEKPLDLLRWLVRTYTQPGQVVLDTFAGSGTTAVACVQEGRQFIGAELDENYCAKAQARVALAQHELAEAPPITASEFSQPLAA